MASIRGVDPVTTDAARAGLRLGELLGLDWTDLDEKQATLTIDRAFVRGTLTTPKNHQRRKADVSPQLLKALLALRASQRAFALKKGRPAPAIMFPAVGGVERLDESNVRKVLKRICIAAKIRPRSPHCLRDTFASQLLSKNAPLLYVSRQLGHSSAPVIEPLREMAPEPDGSVRQRPRRRGLSHLWVRLWVRRGCDRPRCREECLIIGVFVVSLNVASWNQLDEWLRQLDGMRLA